MPNNKEIKFDGYSLKLQYLSSDDSIRVKIETSMDQYEEVSKIPLLPKGLYRITIKPIAEEIK